MFSELLQAFLLGNSAILTNVCILPLYPGLIAFLAGNEESGRSSAGRWLGAAVLAGVLTLMIGLGLIFYLIGQPLSRFLPFLLPVIYAVVILLGLLLLAGRNPFHRLGTLDAAGLTGGGRFRSAFLYGLLLGPMTLPCTGPIIVSAFLLGAGSVGSLATELLFFAVFGLGFGWPLILLPFVTGSLQRRFTRWMGRNVALLNKLSGALLLAIGLFGIFVDWLPNL